jgi:hypothetical protein
MRWRASSPDRSRPSRYGSRLILRPVSFGRLGLLVFLGPGSYIIGSMATASNLCSEDGCDRPTYAKGLCNRHYQAARRKSQGTPTRRSSDGWHRLSNIDAVRKMADCSQCGPGVPIRVRTPYPSRCRTALREEARRYGPAKRERERKSSSGYSNPRRWHLGITNEKVQEMLDDQSGTCAICLKQLQVPAVDHCHTTGTVRGLLCRSCNLALSYLRDNPDSAMRAAAYLRAC